MTTLAAYGHSWVVGEAASAPGRTFVALVARRLGADVENHAVGGSSCADTARLVEQDGCAAADLYVLMAGLNDARMHGSRPTGLRAYAQCLTTVLTAFRSAAPAARRVCIAQPTLLDYSRYPPHDRGSSDAVSAHNDVVRQVCRAQDAVCVEVTGWDPATMLDADTVHPNDRGHALIASAVWSALGRAPSIATTRPVHD